MIKEKDLKRLRLYIAAVLCCAVSSSLHGQTYYNGTDVTGQLVLTRTVNVMQLASAANGQGFGLQSFGLRAPGMTTRAFGLRTLGLGLTQEITPNAGPRHDPPTLGYPFSPASPAGGMTTMGRVTQRMAIAGTVNTAASDPVHDLTIVGGAASAGFNGLTHRDQRMANGGNQYSVEPPNPSIATAHNYVLEGVNNAIQVYNLSGTPLLPVVLSTNQLFGVTPAIDRATGINGVYPTDMRVFYDQASDRWFVLQRAQDYDIFGNLLSTSHYYLAVSQTGDPTGTYNIYTMDTTNASYPGCPCVADYPQIGADQYGLYISANQYQSLFEPYVAASILAISKIALAEGAAAPPAFQFNIPFTTGDEFTIQPAVTPPGGSYFLANGGVEYFVSTRTTSGNAVALWALSNTSSFVTQPQLLLTKVLVPTLNYSLPPVATQPPGFRPYGSSLFPPGQLPFIETGDTRALSVSYVGGRLYIAVASRVTDQAGHSLAGGAYIVVSAAIRRAAANVPATPMGSVVQQGYLVAANNNLLFPSMAVDAHGHGAIAATLTGPDWYPSTVFVPFTTFSAPSILRVVAAGVLPEDGFTAYKGVPARWGDYSGAVVSPDGSLWIVSEYIGNLPRTDLANWQTFIAQFNP